MKPAHIFMAFAHAWSKTTRAHEFLLDVQHRTASVQVEGSPASAARLWSRLHQQKPIRIGVIGASVAMSGGCQREHQPHVRCADYDGFSAEKRWAYGGRSKGRVRGFVMQALDWINATWPHREHQVYNGASDGNPAAVLEKCMLSALPVDVDLVLLEFGSARSDPYSVERIMRRLLRLPHQPWLVLVNVREWCRCGEKLVVRTATGKPKRSNSGMVNSLDSIDSLTSRGNGTWRPQTCSASGDDVRTIARMFSRWPGPEDDFAALCRHYSQTCVSLRDALFTDIMREAPGFSIAEVAADCVHPSRGSKGHRYLGDLVVHALQRSWSQYQGESGDLTTRAQSASQSSDMRRFPPALHDVNRACASDAQAAWRCYSFEVNPSAHLQNDRVLTGRYDPEPNVPGQARPAPVCNALAECVLAQQQKQKQQQQRRRPPHQLQLRQQRRTSWRRGQMQPTPGCVQELGHWQYCSRAFNKARTRKPGLVAFRAGASMRVHIDADVTGIRTTPSIRDSKSGGSYVHAEGDPCSQFAQRTSGACALVSLSYLTSYEQMGIVLVSCEGGCACMARSIDAHVTDATRNVSIVRESVLRVAPGPRCVLRFVVSNISSSGGHKWKLFRVAVGVAQPEMRRGEGYTGLPSLMQPTSAAASARFDTERGASCVDRQPRYRGWINMRAKSKPLGVNTNTEQEAMRR